MLPFSDVIGFVDGDPYSQDPSWNNLALVDADGDAPPALAMRRHFSAGDLSLSSVALTADARFAATGSWDNSVLLYSVESACVVTTIDDAHDALVSALALAPGGGAGAPPACCSSAMGSTLGSGSGGGAQARAARAKRRRQRNVGRA